MAAASEEPSEESIQTEPSGPDERAAYGPYKTGDNPRIEEYRQWWRNNPLNNIWTPKPQLWRRFVKEVEEGKTPEEAARSGANTTLDDLRKAAPSQPAAEDVPVDWEHMDSDDVWAGRPDPDVYDPSTNALAPEQLEEERRKGHVMTLRDFRKMLAEAEPWELEAAKELMEAKQLQNTPAITYPDGSTISVWDLYEYTHHNPELRALVEKGVHFNTPQQGRSNREHLATAPTWQLDPDATHMVLRPHEASALEWGIAAQGEHWSRLPTRWLKGLDGRRDFGYGVYVHEDATARLLGPRWRRRNPLQVVADPEFARDIVRSAPAIGMTLMCVASRPLPIAQLQDEWIGRLSAILRRQAQPPLPAPMPPADSGASTSQTSAPLASVAAPLTGAAPWLRVPWGGGGSAPAPGDAASGARRGPGRPSLFAAITSPLGFLARGGGGGSSSSSTSGTDSSDGASSSGRTSSSEEEPVSAASKRSTAQPPAAAAVPSAKPKAPPAQPQPAQPQRAQQAPAAQRASPVVAAAAVQPARPSASQGSPQAAAAPTVPAAAAAAAAPPPPPPPPRVAPPRPPVEGPWGNELTALRSMFDAEHLAAGTKLVDATGKLLREGSKIIMTAVPDGRMLVQAVSPGTMREQQSYVLGSILDPTLTSAILALFVDPDCALDPAFVRRLSGGVLFFANGFKTPTHGRQAPGVTPLPQPTPRSRWGLPKVGSVAPPPLLSNVRRHAMMQRIDDAFNAAQAAVEAVVARPGEDERVLTVRRRMAAERALQQELGDLGLDEEELLLPPPELEGAGAAASRASSTLRAGGQ